MRHATAATALVALAIVPVGSAGLRAQSVLGRMNPPPLARYAASASIRVGIQPVERDGLARHLDTTEAGQRSSSHRVARAAIGGGLGLAAGAAVGAVVMSVSDKHDGGIGFPPAAAGAFLGGAIGIVLGTIIGATIR